MRVEAFTAGCIRASGRRVLGRIGDDTDLVVYCRQFARRFGSYPLIDTANLAGDLPSQL